MKKIIFGFLGFVGVFVLLSAPLSSFAKEQPNGTPFKAIWEAIINLQDQINDISLIPGPPGPKGDKGDIGAQGPIGEQGIQGLKGDTGEQGPSGSSLHLYDADNQDLGVVIDASNRQKISTYDSDLGLIFPFMNLDTNVVLNGQNDRTIYFAGEDCTGDAYFDMNFQPFIFMSTALSSNPRYFRIDDYNTGGSTQTTKSCHSTWEATCTNNPVPASKFLYLAKEFALPFNMPIASPLEIS